MKDHLGEAAHQVKVAIDDTHSEARKSVAIIEDRLIQHCVVSPRLRFFAQAVLFSDIYVVQKCVLLAPELCAECSCRCSPKVDWL